MNSVEIQTSNEHEQLDKRRRRNMAALTSGNLEYNILLIKHLAGSGYANVCDSILSTVEEVRRNLSFIIIK